uniref:Uncharacterized protein n=1 Tax=Anguilla anguilla TaxID=7936 RepID=A0A0E9VMV5_ANGAN
MAFLKAQSFKISEIPGLFAILNTTTFCI